MQSREVKAAADAKEAERMAMQSIDWCVPLSGLACCRRGDPPTLLKDDSSQHLRGWPLCILRTYRSGCGDF